MKKNLLLISIFWLIFTTTQGQSLELTFNASHYGQTLELDSLLIENTTQGGEIMLIEPPATIEIFNLVTDIGNILSTDKTFSIRQNSPNPFAGKTNIEILLPKADAIEVHVTDMNGRLVAHRSETLMPGIHLFSFQGGSQKVYLLSVQGSEGTNSIKMLQKTGSSTPTGKAHLIYQGMTKPGNSYKASQEPGNFVFTFGDVLRFTGFATTSENLLSSDVRMDAPEANTTYDLAVIEGLPCPEIPMFTYEGQEYKTVHIGDQCWMKENLNVGSMLAEDELPEQNGIVEKYCIFDDPLYCDTYGGLYSWDEMMSYSTQPGTQGICPEGWHLPTEEEWILLEEYLGGSTGIGGKFKEIGTTHWTEPNEGATNESGFTALPGDYFQGTWEDPPGNKAFFWTSTEFDSFSAIERQLFYNHSNIFGFGFAKFSACSVRCIKD